MNIRKWIWERRERRNYREFVKALKEEMPNV